MAVAFESVQTNTGTGGVVVVTKPTSLAVGDLMLSLCGVTGDDQSNSYDWSGPAGWTNFFGGNPYYLGNFNRGNAFWKIATSGDVAASNFTFTFSQSKSVMGAVYRISGVSPVNPFGTQGDNGTAVVPDVTNTILVMLALGAANGVSISDYAVANNNPSWTEDFDFTTGGAMCIAGAHGSYSPASTTGTSSLTVNGSNAAVQWTMIAVRPSIPATIAPTTVNLGLTGGANLIRVGVKLIITAAHLIITGGTQLFTRSISWINGNKNTSTFTNQTKNTSTFTNQSKNSTTWSNPDKST